MKEKIGESTREFVNNLSDACVNHAIDHFRDLCGVAQFVPNYQNFVEVLGSDIRVFEMIERGKEDERRQT
jgi:hypothetical protein